MKKQLNKKNMALLAMALLIAAVACSPADISTENAQAAAPSAVASRAAGELPMQARNLRAADTALSDEEIEGLLFMREEEKLAGDVYRYLYDLWGSSVFRTIAQSEDMHTEAVMALLDAYGIEDIAQPQPGQFSNADLQALYDQLTEQGSQSLQDAFLVGAAIEEIDLLDLEARIAQTDNGDIIAVYENLIRGTENHLRAFVRVLGNQIGMEYTPQYLTQAQFDAVLQSQNGMGRGMGRQGAGRGNRGGRGSRRNAP